MRKGEKWILIIIAVTVAAVMIRNIWRLNTDKSLTEGIPFYSTAQGEVAKQGPQLYHKYRCKNCHSLWTVRNIMQNVPAPALDGIGSLREEQWFYDYFSSADPQSVLPSRLKKEYRMPSYAGLPEHERRLLAGYMASLKVEDRYLEQVRKAEYEKLTGKEYSKK